ncbi:MAG: hypothetical protein U1F51_00230 [Burkholderiales bacterium]
MTSAAPPYSPYRSDAANAIYNLAFCDDVAAFAARPGQSPTPWQAALASEPADVEALRRLADDEREEGRIRYLASRRLRENGRPAAAKRLYGVVVEMPLDGGLDTLAATSEGGVRYVNQSGRIAVIEPVPAIVPLVERLFAAAQPVVDRIGPWSGARRPPPSAGAIRLSFLVSDGLYFGEGPFTALERDPMAAPVIARATELLQAVVALRSE